MNIQKILNNIKTKITPPSLYAIELGYSNYTIIYGTIAYSLEDAILEAREEIAREMKITLKDAHAYQIKKYRIRKLSDILTPFINTTNKSVSTQQSVEVKQPAKTKEEIEINKTKTEKNELMQKIIETQDVRLFEHNLNKFTDAEQHFLKVKLNV